jgi:uncharacterized membrane protein
MDGTDGAAARRERLWSSLLPSWVRRFPADLAAVVGLTLVTLGSAFLPLVRGTALRVVLATAFVLFVPGYAFAAALFPSADGRAEGEHDEGRITALGRIALSFGLSVAVVPLVGLGLEFTPWGVALVPIVASLALLVFGLVAVAVRRRAELAPDDRFSVAWREWLSSARGELFVLDSRTDAVVNALLTVSVVLAAASVGYAVAVPKPGESFSEFYLLTEGPGGELAADDYPTEFRPGERRGLVVGIENHERESVEYTVVVQLQDVAVQNNTTRVLEREELRRFQTRLGHNETWLRNYSVQPTMTGDRLRLVFLLYEGDAPGNPAVGNARRELHLWVNVSRPS